MTKISFTAGLVLFILLFCLSLFFPPPPVGEGVAQGRYTMRDPPGLPGFPAPFILLQELSQERDVNSISQEKAGAAQGEFLFHFSPLSSNRPTGLYYVEDGALRLEVLPYGEIYYFSIDDTSLYFLEAESSKLILPKGSVSVKEGSRFYRDREAEMRHSVERTAE